MHKVSLVMCNDMHMDIEQANEMLSCICQNSNYQISSNYTEADIIIIMTCAFGSGKKYSMYVIADVQRNCKKDAALRRTCGNRIGLGYLFPYGLPVK